MLADSDEAALLSLLFERLPVGVAVFDTKYRLMYSNQTWRDYAGQYSPLGSAGVTPGVSWFDIGPGTEAQVGPLFERVLAGETVHVNALPLEVGGIRTYWDAVLSPLTQDGRVRGIVNMATDATERTLEIARLKRERADIEEREHWLESVMDAANDGLWDWNLQTGEVFYSRRWKHMLGYEEDEIAGRMESWRDLVHPDDVTRALAAIEAHQRGETSHYIVEHRLRHKDGGYRWMLARGTALRDAEGQPVRMVGSHTDITEQKIAESALRERTLFENTITGISTQFINLAPGEIDDGIVRALRTLGLATGVDRSYLFQFTGTHSEMSCTHEWCAKGIEPQIDHLQNMPVDALSWSNTRILRGDILHIPRVADLPPEAEAERIEFTRQGIQSLVVVPMMYRGEIVGFIGFDSVRAEKMWPEPIIALLTIVGEVFVSALQNKRAQKIQAGQQQFLELLATGGGFHQTLQTLVEIIEEQWPGMKGLILLMDEDGRHLRVGAAASLPEEYTQSIEGLEIGPMVGSCGTAAYTRQRVIVEDIAADPRWEGLRDLAEKYNLGACWSEPVLSAEGEVLGTFAMYYHARRAPSAAELQTIEVAAHLVGIAIQHQRAEDALRQAYETLEQRVEERTAEIEKRRRVAESLGEVLRVLNSNMPLHDILDRIIEQARRIMEADAAVLTRINYEQRQVVFASRQGTPPEVDWVEGYPLHAAEVTDSAVLGRQPLVIEEAREALQEVLRRERDSDPGLRAWREATLNRYTSALVVPLIVRDNVYGSLSLYYSQPMQFSDEDVELANRFADHTSLAIENARLYEQAKEAAAAGERNRLARELHDAVTQTLFSTSLIAEVLPVLWERNRPEAEKRLQEIRQLTRGALAEMRTLLLELRPTSLVEVPLPDLLRQLTEALSARGRVDITLDVTVVEPPPRDVKMALYRTTQEALNNVLKHAQATQVHVAGRCEAERVELSIRDDGRGFDFESIPPDHLGLSIMRERADAIGARLSIDSAVGEGTEVRVCWQA